MNKSDIIQELKLKAVRSSGAGGQHVNKVSTKVELSFDVMNSDALSENEKERIQRKLKARLTKEGILTLNGDSTRSQHRNKELVIKRLFKLLEEALKVPKKRKKTKPSRGAIEKRLKSKLKNAQKKGDRKKPDIE